MEEEIKLIKEVINTDKVNAVLSSVHIINQKQNYASIEMRKKGNDLYKKKIHTSNDHEEIWKFYTKSIASAPCKNPDELEELAVGYGNRSAFFYHIGKFKESIIDIDRALKITKTSTLITKLLDRKAKCQAAMEKNDQQVLNCTEIEVCQMDDVEMSDGYQNRGISDYKDQITDILSAKAAEDPFESVYLRYNKKYGRHLLAKREIMPGEIIMSVKPYVLAVNGKNQYIFCGHCMKTAWNSIPCDNCTWCMFCSEECKREAWQKYHDIECQVVSCFMAYNSTDYWKQLSLRSIIMAIRQAGSIAELRTELSKIDKCQRELYKGFVNGEFRNDTFHSIYSLSKNVAPDILECHADQSVLILIYIVKASSLFGVDFNTNKELVENKDVVFVGALFLRFMRISDINAHLVSEGSNDCRFSKDPETCSETHCCERGVCIAGVPSFVNHSCFPNIRKCFTEDMRLVIYAVQPIPKNGQLFDSYVGYFFERPKSVRQIKLKDFNLICACPPCKEDWPAILLETKMAQRYISYREENRNIESEFLDTYNNFLKNLNNDLSKGDLTAIEYLSKTIVRANAQLVQPCYATALLMSTLWNVFDHVFGCKLQISDKCIT